MKTQGGDGDTEMKHGTDVGTRDADKDVGTELSKLCRSCCRLHALPRAVLSF